MLKGIMAWMQGTGHSRQEDSLSKGPEAGCSKAEVEDIRKGRVGDGAGETGEEQMEPGRSMEQTRENYILGAAGSGL